MTKEKNLILSVLMVAAVAIILQFSSQNVRADGSTAYMVSLCYGEYDSDGIIRPAGNLMNIKTEIYQKSTDDYYVLNWPDDRYSYGAFKDSNTGKEYSIEPFSIRTIVTTNEQEAKDKSRGGYYNSFSKPDSSVKYYGYSDGSTAVESPGIHVYNSDDKTVKVFFSSNFSKANLTSYATLEISGIEATAHAIIASSDDKSGTPSKPFSLTLQNPSIPEGYELDETYYKAHDYSKETTVSFSQKDIERIQNWTSPKNEGMGSISGKSVCLIVKKKGAASNYGKARSMYRLYNKNSGEHFYTGNVSERNSLVKVGWCYEGIAWSAPSKSNMPVYRLYNKNSGDHHYTISASERNSLIKAGWRDEGIGWYAGGSYAVYRQYNPNAKTGSHNFTTSKAENDSLVKAGWKAEGISWYAG